MGHGDEHDHAHLSDPAWQADMWSHDNLILTTIGIDVGSTTSHLMLAEVHLQRVAQGLSSRFEVVGRKVTWASEVIVTPVTDGERIDGAALEAFVTGELAAAGITPEQIDSGVVILTGLALLRDNAEAIATLLSDASGRLVCTLAGHHREAVMAGLGSGAAAWSRETGDVVLNIDIGGGTTKLALIDEGAIVSTAAIAVGARLVVRDHAGRVARVEPAARVLAAAAGIDLVVGRPLASADEQALCAAMVTAVAAAATGRSAELPTGLLLTEPLDPGIRPDVVTFSGGVSEYVHEREARAFGDLGPMLGRAIRGAAEEDVFGVPWQPSETGIRATAVGLSQFSVQASGNTVSLGNGSALPVRNVPIVASVDLGADDSAESIADDLVEAIERATAGRGDDEWSGPAAVSVSWHAPASFDRLEALARGLAGLLEAAYHTTALIVLLDRDLASSLGSVIAETATAGIPVVCLDGIDLDDCDYVDVGEVQLPANVVPVTAKSLLFMSDAHAA